MSPVERIYEITYIDIFGDEETIQCFEKAAYRMLEELQEALR